MPPGGGPQSSSANIRCMCESFLLSLSMDTCEINACVRGTYGLHVSSAYLSSESPYTANDDWEGTVRTDVSQHMADT
jgi:hypothetical protein